MTTLQLMQQQQLIQLIRSTQPDPGKPGKMFEATFIKKDGSIRKMRCRIGYTKGLTGKGMSFDPIERGLYPVWSADTQDRRFINLNTLMSLRLPDGHKHLIKSYGNFEVI